MKRERKLSGYCLRRRRRRSDLWLHWRRDTGDIHVARFAPDAHPHPQDFMDERHCRWFVVFKAKARPNLRHACNTCGAVSRTKECQAFRGKISPPTRQPAAILDALKRR